MCDNESFPNDLFGNPITERKNRRRASQARASAQGSAVPISTPVMPNPKKLELVRRPVRLYQPSKWPYLALVVTLAVLVSAAALKIPLAKTPVVELDLSASDSRTTIGLMSAAVFGCVVWSICEALATVFFNCGLKTSRKPVVCANNHLKGVLAGVIAMLTIAGPISLAWLTWKYTHPQVRYVVAVLDEFLKHPPSDLETGAIVVPVPVPAPRGRPNIPSEMEEVAPDVKNPSASTNDPAELKSQKPAAEQPQQKSKSRRNVSGDARDKDWIAKADRWFTEIFSSPEDPRRPAKRN